MRGTIESTVSVSAEDLVFRVLLQLVVILVVSRGTVMLAKRVLGQTDVTGEILGGLVLGPSVFGALAPNLMNRIFVPSTSSVLSGIAQMGLVFLMFQIGQEFEFGHALHSSK